MTEVAGKMASVLEILRGIYYFRSMKKLLYVHGYNGSPDGGSCRLFKKHKPENWEVIGMDYCQDDCELALRQIRETIEREGIDVVVGCSLGGFAHYGSAAFCGQSVLSAFGRAAETEAF